MVAESLSSSQLDRWGVLSLERFLVRDIAITTKNNEQNNYGENDNEKPYRCLDAVANLVYHIDSLSLHLEPFLMMQRADAMRASPCF